MFSIACKFTGNGELKIIKNKEYCKFLHDTKDRNFCKPEKIYTSFSGCNFSIFLGNTIYNMCVQLCSYVQTTRLVWQQTNHSECESGVKDEELVD